MTKKNFFIYINLFYPLYLVTATKQWWMQFMISFLLQFITHTNTRDNHLGQRMWISYTISFVTFYLKMKHLINIYFVTSRRNFLFFFSFSLNFFVWLPSYFTAGNKIDLQWYFTIRSFQPFFFLQNFYILKT